MKVPAYRQEAYWAISGYPIPRHNMTNWHIKCSEYYFEDFVSLMKVELLQTEILHADETTFKVLADKDREKSYVWLFSTGKHTKIPIHIYHLGPSRSAEVPKAFFKNFKGYLHTEGYNGYSSLGEEVISVACLANIRRYFFDARPKKYEASSPAHQGVQFCNDIFKLDKGFEKNSSKNRFKLRLRHLRSKLNAFLNGASQ